MDILMGIVMIAIGVALMGFGLLMLYRFYWLIYALLGAALGVWFANLFPAFSTGIWPWIFGAGGAVIFALLSRLLFAFRGVLLGLLGGAVVGLAFASLFGLGNFLAFVFAVVGAIIGLFLMPLFFDPFVIAVTAIGGSALVMDGIVKIIPGLDMFNRSSGEIVPIIIWIVLMAVGVGWQFRNIANWVERKLHDALVSSAKLSR